MLKVIFHLPFTNTEGILVVRCSNSITSINECGGERKKSLKNLCRDHQPLNLQMPNDNKILADRLAVIVSRLGNKLKLYA